MTRRRKVTLAAFVLLLLTFAAGVLLFSERNQMAGPVTFRGWTNVAGETHALFHFPPVETSDPRNSFWSSSFYTVRLEFTRTLPNGKTNGGHVQLFRESPKVVTSILIPCEGASSLIVTRAKGSIERRWDYDVPLPFSLPSTEYTFIPPEALKVPSED